MGLEEKALVIGPWMLLKMISLTSPINYKMDRKISHFFTNKGIKESKLCFDIGNYS